MTTAKVLGFNGDFVLYSDNDTVVTPDTIQSSGTDLELVAGDGSVISESDFVVASGKTISAPGIVAQIAEGHVSTNLTTTSTSLVDMTGASVTINLFTGSKVMLGASYSTSTNSILGAVNTVVLVVDGSVVAGSANTLGTLANSAQSGGFSRLITGLSIGTHTFKLQWSTSTGTAQCRPSSNPNTEHASITVMEILG